MFILAECEIPPVITGILSQLYKIIIVLIPIGIVIFGSIDFIKATIAKNSDAIATTTKTFISRLIAGAVTFFVLSIVSWLFTIIIGNVNEANSAMDCALKIIGGTASSSYGKNLNNYINNNISIGDKIVCFSKQYSMCISTNQSPNKEEDCTRSANAICGTTKKPTTTTTKANICEECKKDHEKDILNCVGSNYSRNEAYDDCSIHYESRGFSIGNYDSNYFLDAAALYAECVQNNGNINSTNCKKELENYNSVIQKYNFGSNKSLPEKIYTKSDEKMGFSKGLADDEYINKCNQYANNVLEQEKEKCAKNICKEVCN
ncbi:MAG: hypothetical protein HFI86_05400 [Bacilli bacterium]|nr:hypothetical protein [Bacilli bacterium]